MIPFIYFQCNHSTLCDIDRELWDGPRTGPEDALDLLGVDEVSTDGDIVCANLEIKLSVFFLFGCHTIFSRYLHVETVHMVVPLANLLLVYSVIDWLVSQSDVQDVIH